MEVFACIFIIAFGSLGHFIFEWSGHRSLAGVFFAVNESTWEHIKLVIYPTFIWGVVEAELRGWSEDLLTVQFVSMITMMLLIPALFYGYTAITKKNWLIPDILCFCIAVIAGVAVYYALADLQLHSVALNVISAVGLAAILVMYLSFSYFPPQCFLFKDPLSGHYGPKGHGCHSHFHHTH